jgi:hypothetical protein
VVWIASTFIGGAINALAIQAFTEYYDSMIQALRIEYPAPTIIPAADIFESSALQILLVFLAPIFLSLIFTKFLPERRVVKPFDIQALSFAAFAYAKVMVPTSRDFGGLLLLGMYALFGGLTQNALMSKLVGVAADRSLIVSYSRLVYVTPQRLADLLTSNRFRRNLNLKAHVERTGDGRLILRSVSTLDYSMVFEIAANNDPPNSALLNMVFYERIGQYLRRTDEFEEYVLSTIVYLQDVLNRQSVRWTVRLDTEAAPLVDSVVNELQGLSVYAQRVSRIGWIKILAFLGAVSVAGVAFFLYLKDYTSGYATIVLILLYLAFELPPRLRPR